MGELERWVTPAVIGARLAAVEDELGGLAALLDDERGLEVLAGELDALAAAVAAVGEAFEAAASW
jgi:hypothetical protein